MIRALSTDSTSLCMLELSRHEVKMVHRFSEALQKKKLNLFRLDALQPNHGRTLGAIAHRNDARPPHLQNHTLCLHSSSAPYLLVEA